MKRLVFPVETLNTILHHSEQDSHKQPNHSHLQNVCSPPLCLKAGQQRVGPGRRRRCCLHYNNIFPRSRPSCDCTRAGDQESVTAIRRWNYQDKHRPVSLPSPLLASAPPPAHLCAFSPWLRNAQTAAFITDLGSVIAGIV